METKNVLRNAGILSAMLFVMSAAVGFSPAQSPLTITGIVKTSDGPVKNRVVMFLPYDAVEGKPVTIYPGGKTTLSKEGRRNSAKEPWTFTYYIISSKGLLQNARTVSDDNGQFTLKIDNFPRTPPPGMKLRVGVGVFDGTVEAPIASVYEIEYLEVDANAVNLDAKRIVLKPIKEKDAKP